MLSNQNIEDLLNLQEDYKKSNLQNRLNDISLLEKQLNSVELNQVKVKKRNLFFRIIDNLKFILFKLRKKYHIKLPSIKINID